MDEELDRVAAVMDAEVRAEQAAYEAMALQAEWRARSLTDVVRELVVRGDTIDMTTAGQTIAGTVVHAGADYAVVDGPRGYCDVALAVLTTLRVTQRSRDGGNSPARGAATLRARMTEHETAEAPLTILLATGEMLEGRVRAAASDHLLLEDRRGAVVIPWRALAAAWPAPAQG